VPQGGSALMSLVSGKSGAGDGQPLPAISGLSSGIGSHPGQSDRSQPRPVPRDSCSLTCEGWARGPFPQAGVWDPKGARGSHGEQKSDIFRTLLGKSSDMWARRGRLALRQVRPLESRVPRLSVCQTGLPVEIALTQGA
jgi:hypothetical protein